jgi:hypothetical protein
MPSRARAICKAKVSQPRVRIQFSRGKGSGLQGQDFSLEQLRGARDFARCACSRQAKERRQNRERVP